MIGIFVKKPENVFSNGCIQQSYYLLKQLRLTGNKCCLVAAESDYHVFEINSEPIIHASKIKENGVALILFVSGSVSDEAGLKFLKEEQGAKLVSVVCGNYFILHQEEYVFDRHHIIKHSHNEAYKKYMDENWVLPMYAEFRDYIALMTGVKTKVTPYVWDSDAIDQYMSTNKITIKVDPQKFTKESQVMLLIFEPNMSTHKTSLVPLLQADQYYASYKDRLHSVHHFCTNVNESSTYFINSLQIQRDKKLMLYQRMIMPAVVANLMTLYPNVVPVVLSHNFHNELNFLHLELFYLGVPVVHNCGPLKAAGRYYTTETMQSAIDQVEHLRESIHIPKFYRVYTDDCKKMVNYYRPNNQQHIKQYSKHIKNVN